MTRKFAAMLVVGATLGLVPPAARLAPPALGQDLSADRAAYRTPYRVEFKTNPAELVADLERTERGDPRLEAEIPYPLWYSRRAFSRWHSWGPAPRHYPPPRGLDEWPAEQRRERVVAVALRYLGYAYQHHHIPDWDPPADWPWKETCAGRNGKGVDCSNFTSFVYNIGFGMRLNSEVHHQSEERVAERLGAPGVPLHPIRLPESYEERVRTLRTGDLVFIRSRQGKISHVVLWVGPIGLAPDQSPLIIDSHGEGVRDCDGKTIPCGIQLRPFRENSWYNHSASHALRLIPDDRR